jgi:D-3-phosphoglycerate dehydrogenase
MSKNIPAFVDCYGDLAERFNETLASTVPGLEVFYDKPANEDELISRLQGRKNVMVYMGYMSSKVLNSCPDLKTISYLSTGLATHGNLEEASKLDIRFEGVKGYGDRAVAEHTIGLAFAAIKRLTEMDRTVRSGNWKLIKTEELQGKTFGVIGLGGIGLETAKIAKSLGMRTLCWSRSSSRMNLPVETASLDQVLKQSDIISLHLPLNSETQGFINHELLSKTKRGLILINTARAEIIDEQSLICALSSGHIGHCALDVFHQEPLAKDNDLLLMENVTVSPHSAWLTTQAIDRLILAGLNLLNKHILETQND